MNWIIICILLFGSPPQEGDKLKSTKSIPRIENISAEELQRLKEPRAQQERLDDFLKKIDDAKLIKEMEQFPARRFILSNGKLNFFQILRIKAVRSELKISPETSRELENLLNSWANRTNLELDRLDHEYSESKRTPIELAKTRLEIFSRSCDDLEKELKKGVLSDSQMKRLRQLTLWHATLEDGTGTIAVLLSEPVQDEIKLSPEEITRLKEKEVALTQEFIKEKSKLLSQHYSSFLNELPPPLKAKCTEFLDIASQIREKPLFLDLSQNGRF